MKEDVLLFQEISSNAWPAINFVFLNGWIVRLGDGYTRRANSVLPIRYSGKSPELDILQVERLYSQFDLPTVFQLPDYFAPSALKKLLLARGYEEVDESLLMAQNIAKLKRMPINDDFSYTIDTSFSDKWFKEFRFLTGKSTEAERKNKEIIRRIPFKKGFIFATKGNEIAGLCLGVLEREFLGIYDMIVSPKYRRQKIGQSILMELIDWGKVNGATTCYLQVQGDNNAAIPLYSKIGLEEKYRYRYLINK